MCHLPTQGLARSLWSINGSHYGYCWHAPMVPCWPNPCGSKFIYPKTFTQHLPHGTGEKEVSRSSKSSARDTGGELTAVNGVKAVGAQSPTACPWLGWSGRPSWKRQCSS